MSDGPRVMLCPYCGAQRWAPLYDLRGEPLPSCGGKDCPGPTKGTADASS